MNGDDATRGEIIYHPIGVIRSPHQQVKETPIQPVYADDVEGSVEVFPEYADGLQDLDGFTHIHLIYHFHCSGPARLKVKPFLQDVERGLFATRAPCRPNGVGLSLVRLLAVDGATLRVAGMDIIDGTPLLDIKPFVRRFDVRAGSRDGWQEGVEEADARKRGRREYRGGA